MPCEAGNKYDMLIMRHGVKCIGQSKTYAHQIILTRQTLQYHQNPQEQQAAARYRLEQLEVEGQSRVAWREDSYFRHPTPASEAVKNYLRIF